MKLKLADYVIGFLADKGIDKMFVVYGAANGDLIDAFTRNNKTDYVGSLNASYTLDKANIFAGYIYTQINDDDVVLSLQNGTQTQNIVYKNTD